MNVEYVPLLSVQRELYTLPRGRERFYEYLRTMRNDESRPRPAPGWPWHCTTHAPN